jgi:hypothetical protein
MPPIVTLYGAYLHVVSAEEVKEISLSPGCAKTARKGECLAAYSLRVQPPAVLDYPAEVNGTLPAMKRFSPG